MSEAVLISIRPEWCKKILSGKKTIEIRKTRPNLKTPFKCYIYETYGYERVGNDNLNCVVGGKGRHAVVGEFICDYIQNLFYDSDVRYGIDHPNDYAKKIMEGSCLTLWDMLDYLNGKDGYMWHISDLVIYAEPKPLKDLHPDCSKCGYVNARDGRCDFIIKRPPQSWCYVRCVP